MNLGKGILKTVLAFLPIWTILRMIHEEFTEYAEGTKNETDDKIAFTLGLLIDFAEQNKENIKDGFEVQKEKNITP